MYRLVERGVATLGSGATSSNSGGSRPHRALGTTTMNEWDQRARHLGHTGWSEQLLYRHDQPLRLRAIEQVLDRTHLGMKGQRALDLGCGTGDVSALLLARGMAVAGLDCSTAVIDIARQTGRRDQPAFVVGDVAKLPVAPGTVDLITSVTVLQHLADPALADALAAAQRALRPSGHLLLLELCSRARWFQSSTAFLRHPKEWRRHLEDAGFSVRLEATYPQAVVTTFAVAAAVRARTRGAGRDAPAHLPTSPRATPDAVKTFLLRLVAPVDRWALRFPPMSIAPYRLILAEQAP